MANTGEEEKSQHKYFSLSFFKYGRRVQSEASMKHEHISPDFTQNTFSELKQAYLDEPYESNSALFSWLHCTDLRKVERRTRMMILFILQNRHLQPRCNK